MRFVLLVEGRTEYDSAAKFLKRWLDSRLENPIGIQPVAFQGYAEMARKMPEKARMHLEGKDSDQIVGVVGLLDLYGPSFYPPDKVTVAERYDWGKQHFESLVANERFRMFFAVHEFEAWLLSDPEIFPREVAAALPKSIGSPEQVNFQEPPAKLLTRVYRKVTGREYKKTVNGKQLFAKLNPEIAVSKCPYFKDLLTEMLAMAQAAGL